MIDLRDEFGKVLNRSDHTLLLVIAGSSVRNLPRIRQTNLLALAAPLGETCPAERRSFR
jgi:hypothetical protein